MIESFSFLWESSAQKFDNTWETQTKEREEKKLGKSVKMMRRRSNCISPRDRISRANLRGGHLSHGFISKPKREGSQTFDSSDEK